MYAKHDIDKLPLVVLHLELEKKCSELQTETIKLSYRFTSLNNRKYNQLNVSIRDKKELLFVLDWFLNKGIKVCITKVKTLEHENNYLISLKEELKCHLKQELKSKSGRHLKPSNKTGH